jgi:predicted dehydrogenase
VSQHAKNIRSIGIVGAGEIVSRLHLPVLKALPTVKVAWITDANNARASSVATGFGIPAVAPAARPDELPDADVVLLAIPYGVRAGYYAALQSRVCALYVEKPFAKTVAEHEALCAGRPSSHIACGYQRRVMTSVQTVRSLVKEQVFGPLERIEFGLGRRGGIRSGTHQSNVKMAGGGMFFETGVHGLDALLFIAGAEQAELCSGSVAMLEDFEVHVDTALRIRTAQGVDIPAQVTVTALEDSIECLRLTFKRAQLTFSIYNDQPILIRSVSGERLLATLPDHQPRVATLYQTAFVFWRTFIEGMFGENANLTSASDSLLTTKIVEQTFALPRQQL